jgi:hypothetical protein
MMTELINFMHPYVAFTALVLVIAEKAHSMAIRDAAEELRVKAIELGYGYKDPDNGQFKWR